MMEKMMHYQPSSIWWKAFNDVGGVKGDGLLYRKTSRLFQFLGKITLGSEKNNLTNTINSSCRFSLCSMWSAKAVDELAWDRHQEGWTTDERQFSLSLGHQREPFLHLIKERHHSLGLVFTSDFQPGNIWTILWNKFLNKLEARSTSCSCSI